MVGYSKVKYEVFKFQKNCEEIAPKVDIETKFLRLNEVTHQQWKQLKQLQGKFTVTYLKLRYSSPDTRILLAFCKEKLIHVEWVVPAKKIQHRYHFVTKNSYLIISCLTSTDFRGKGVYPSQLRRVIESSIPTDTYWGLAATENIPSLKGISKAGGINTGEFIQEKWFWGCISHAEYRPKESAGK
jgi:hypothetical protein